MGNQQISLRVVVNSMLWSPMAGFTWVSIWIEFVIAKAYLQQSAANRDGVLKQTILKENDGKWSPCCSQTA